MLSQWNIAFWKMIHTRYNSSKLQLTGCFKWIAVIASLILAHVTSSKLLGSFGLSAQEPRILIRNSLYRHEYTVSHWFHISRIHSKERVIPKSSKEHCNKWKQERMPKDRYNRFSSKSSRTQVQLRRLMTSNFSHFNVSRVKDMDVS